MLGNSKKKGSFEQPLDTSAVSSSEGDQGLMLQVRGGDVRAFEILYGKFKGLILSYVYQMTRNRTAAEEITQEIFLKVYRVRDTYRPEAKFSTWLWTIARNTALDHLRKKTEVLLEDRAKEDEVLIDQVEAPIPSAEARLIEAADRSRVDGCMEQLTPMQKEALTLRTVSELSYEEIADQMNTTLPSVKSLINRAKKALTDCLTGPGGCDG